MRVLQINCVYKRGSTGKIVEDVACELIKQGNEAYVCYGRKNKNITDKNAFAVSNYFLGNFNALKTRFTGLQYSGSLIATLRAIRYIKKIKPDVVHVHCINGYDFNIYKLLSYLAQNEIKTVVTHHGEFFYTGNCPHSYDCDKWLTGCGNCPNLWQATKSYFLDRTKTAWKKMKKTFDKFKKENIIITSVSDWVDSRARLSPIMEGKNLEIVWNGADTKTFRYTKSDIFSKEPYDFSGKKIVFHVTHFFSDSQSTSKGGKYIVDLANSLKHRDDIVFVVASNGCKEGMTLPENVVHIGSVKEKEVLAKMYSAADLCIITSQKETFSMVCAESLCCGTPVVGFKAGAPEVISIPEYSEFADFGDIQTLGEITEKWVDFKKDNEGISEVISSRAIGLYSKEIMTDKYISIYKKLLGE